MKAMKADSKREGDGFCTAIRATGPGLRVVRMGLAEGYGRLTGRDSFGRAWVVPVGAGVLVGQRPDCVDP